MPTYTNLLQSQFQEISPYDENFTEELLSIAQLFRLFSDAMDEFLLEHGYAGNIDDVEAKVAFIRKTFEQASMTPPRETRLWFTEKQPIQRDTAFQLCFAFGLDGGETDEFFRRTFARERSFDCHQVTEAIYYFCLINGYNWTDAQEINGQIPLSNQKNPGTTVVYTSSIVDELKRLSTKEELVAWLQENVNLFNTNNATAYRMIRDMWEQTAGKNGLLMQESHRFISMADDAASDQSTPLKVGKDGVRLWDAYLAIFQLNRKQVDKLPGERTIRPILAKLHEAAQDSFPDRQGMTKILQGEHLSYERVRKWLILLIFYTWWAQRALNTGGYEAGQKDGQRFLSFMDQALVEAGYPEMYVGNPYDWIFFFCAQDQEPLRLFREIWNTLLGEKLEEHP